MSLEKILIFSDLHIFPHKKSYKRLQDALDVLEWILKTAIEKDIKNIICCGDLFHHRQQIDIITYQKTFEIFEKYKDLNVYLLLGNHDLWGYEKLDISSVIPLSGLKNITVIKEPCSYSIDGFEFGFLPYTHNPIEDLKKIKLKNDFKVLFGHIAVNGAILNKLAGTIAEVSIEHDGEMTKVDAEIFSKYNQVFLGHYHAEQKLNDRVEYVGSPLELNFGEAFQQKHIIVYDLITKEKEYVVNNFSPKHLIINKDNINDHDLQDNFVKLVVDNANDPELVEVKKFMEEKGTASIDLLAIPKKQNEQQAIIDAKDIIKSKEDMLISYIKSVIKDHDLCEDKLLKIGEKICQSS